MRLSVGRPTPGQRWISLALALLLSAGLLVGATCSTLGTESFPAAAGSVFSPLPPEALSPVLSAGLLRCGSYRLAVLWAGLSGWEAEQGRRAVRRLEWMRLGFLGTLLKERTICFEQQKDGMK